MTDFPDDGLLPTNGAVALSLLTKIIKEQHSSRDDPWEHPSTLFGGDLCEPIPLNDDEMRLVTQIEMLVKR